MSNKCHIIGFKCYMEVYSLYVSIGPTYNLDSYTVYRVNLNYSTISTTIRHSNIPPCFCTIYHSSIFCTFTNTVIITILHEVTFFAVYFLSSSLIILYLISTIFWQSRPIHNIKTGCNNCLTLVEPIKLGLQSSICPETISMAFLLQGRSTWIGPSFAHCPSFWLKLVYPVSSITCRKQNNPILILVHKI